MSTSNNLTRHLFVLALTAMVLGAHVEPAFGNDDPKPSEYSAYLMAYFNGEDAPDGGVWGLRYAYSKDARNWKALNNGKPVFDPKVWLRDPFIKRVKGKFHMVHTKGMEYPTIFHWEATDLINWHGGPIDVVHPSGIKAWAPEFFYVESEDLFYVYWASDYEGHHTMHYVTTKDWTDITPKRSDIFYNIGIHDIDLTIVEHDGTYYGFHKPGAYEDFMGNRLSVSKSLHPGEVTFGKDGPGKVVFEDSHPKGTEGPEVIKLIGQDKWYIYGDPFEAPLEAWETTDFVNYAKIPVTTPSGAKHCSMIPITQKELEVLLAEYPNTQKLVIHADRGEQKISRYIYGHFAEHLGRCIYNGIWVGEDSPIPNTRGIRNDVVEALKRIKVPIVRWPGGCFADTYHWKDGIGPREDRPEIINRPGGGIKESNHFGTHEFMDFCEQVGCEPYFCGNVGDGTAEEFSEWVQYTTSNGDSPMANLRRTNGRDKPWKIKYWAIGNEQAGRDYALTYLRFRPYLREYSGNEVYSVACGPVNLDYDWTDLVLRMAGDHMEGLALHNYSWSGERSQSATDFEEDDWFFLLRRAVRMEEHIEKCIGIMDKHDPENSIKLIVDEWGAWHEDPNAPDPHLCYQQNTLRDAMVAAIHFNIFHRHLDRIHMANIAQTVNVIQAMILTEGEKMLLTPTYHVFDMYKVHQDATYLPCDLECGTYTHEAARTYIMADESRDRPFLEELGPLYNIPTLTATASRDDAGKIHVSICNIDPNEGVTVRCEIRGADFKKVSGTILTAPKMNTHNTFDNPDALKPARFDDVKRKGDELLVKMPSKSIVVLELD